MACFYCSQEGLPHIQDAGVCVACNKNSCTRPSGRQDGTYHGEDCRCLCGKFVCLADINGHSRDHGKADPIDCFPGLASLGAATAAVGASLMLFVSDEAPTRELDRAQAAMSVFLATVSPGLSVVRRMTSNCPEAFWRLDKTWGVLFQRPFFTERVVERTLLLTTRVVDLSIRRMQPDEVSASMHLKNIAKQSWKGEPELDLSAFFQQLSTPWREERSDRASPRELAVRHERLGRIPSLEKKVPEEPERLGQWLLEAASWGGRGAVPY